MKPMIALLSRQLTTDEVATKVAEQGRRIELLESELAAPHESTKAFAAASDFERRLATPEAKTGTASRIAR